MRLSADKDSPHFKGDASWFTALLDGVEAKFCREASEEEGWVDCYVKDAAGHHLLTPDGKEAVVERRHGRVEIRRLKEAVYY